MPPPSSFVSVALLRAFASTRAAATSVNRAAGEIGLTARGLQKFLDGAEPHSGTKQKLERWYLRERVLNESETDADLARAAMAVLMHDLSPDRRAATLQRFLTWWEAEFDEAGLPRPGWLEDLRRPEES